MIIYLITNYTWGINSANLFDVIHLLNVFKTIYISFDVTIALHGFSVYITLVFFKL